MLESPPHFTLWRHDRSVIVIWSSSSFSKNITHLLEQQANTDSLFLVVYIFNFCNPKIVTNLDFQFFLFHFWILTLKFFFSSQECFFTKIHLFPRILFSKNRCSTYFRYVELNPFYSPIFHEVNVPYYNIVRRKRTVAWLDKISNFNLQFHFS